MANLVKWWKQFRQYKGKYLFFKTHLRKKNNFINILVDIKTIFKNDVRNWIQIL